MDYSTFSDKIIKEVVTPKREAVYSEFPEGLSAEIKQFLIEENNIKSLYCHQAEMFIEARQRNNIVITTSTASGKTLSFLLPILEEILKNPLTRALFIYPTKALANDQYRNLKPFLEYFGKNRIQAGVYDGDTPVNERSRIRSSANIILTNPEMLNIAFMPHHHQHGFNFVFSNLKYVVIDELHTYRGAFGSHFANVLKRLHRICDYYDAHPQFLCSSATIENPLELAENICGEKFIIINKDGSPNPEKHYYLWQPPIIKGSDFQVPPSSEAANFIPQLVVSNKSFIAFCKSRKEVEVVLRESRDRLKNDTFFGRDFSPLISGYRGGYKPTERKEIENKMVSGELKGLISTNALELGIDIGNVESTVIIGFPGTRASFWQQSGRAGRKGNLSQTFLMLDNLPIDQYISINPDWLFLSGSENAVVDKNNLFIQIAHVRAAAAELPLSLDDIKYFPDLGEIVPVLLGASELQMDNGKFAWNGSEFPAGDYSLRNMDKSRYKLVNTLDDTIVTEMDEIQAFRELHQDAVYIHDGMMYQIESLDTTAHIAHGKPVDVNYYTTPFTATTIHIIHRMKELPLGRTNLLFGDVKVTTSVSGHKRVQFHNHDNLGFQKLEPPLLKSYETEGLWITLPSNVTSLFLKLTPLNPQETLSHYWKNYFDALCFTLLNAAMMFTMTTKEDIGADLIIDSAQNTTAISICIYDMYIGGLGFSDKAYDYAQDIIRNAIQMVAGCKCKDGCSACVGDYHLDKRVVLWGLKNLFEELTTPDNIKIPVTSKKIIQEKPFKLETLKEHWAEFIEFSSTTGEYLTTFLSSVKEVSVENNTLIIPLENAFFKTWMEEKNNYDKLHHMLSYYIAVPNNFKIKFILTATSDSIMNEKVAKRLDDLTN